MANTYTVTKTSMGGSSTGRLDTAINNANSNPGADIIAFNIPTTDAGYDAARGVWRITLTANLPNLTGDTTIDGTTQTANRGNTNTALLGTSGTVGVDAFTLNQVAGPEIEITGATFTAFHITAGSLTLKSIALLKMDVAVYIDSGAGSANLITDCVFGVRANTTTPVAGETLASGVFVFAPSTVTRTILAYTTSAAISSASTATIEDSELFNNYLTITNSGTASCMVRRNLVYNSKSQGVSLTNGSHTIVNNTFRNNGLGITSANAGISLGSGGPHTVDRNLVYNNFGPGVASYSSSSTLITRNSIYGNGTITNDAGDPVSGQIGIDLYSGSAISPFVTTNDSGDADTGGNGLLNFPVTTTATLSGGNLTLAGYARPGSIIELFIASPDPSGFGEGQTYLTTLTEGSGADTDATSGTYSGLINGIDQGTDTTNRFSFIIATPGGVTIGTKLTATATVSNNTSEFSGNVTVTQAYTISGHIQNASAIAISGVTVTLSGGQAGSTTTDASGNYSFTGLPSGANYTVTPSLTGYSFSPASLTYNSLGANQTAADFTGTSTVTYTISGHIQNASGIAIGGVAVTLSGGQSGSTTTDASGNYSFTGLPSTNNYTVTPSKTDYTFSPTSLTYNDLTANQAAADFTGTSTINYTISGHIQNASAVAISGVTVTLSGGEPGSTTTDASGNYSFAGLPSTNNYTVTPTKTNYTFAATSLTYNDLSADQTASDFTGTSTISYTISGHIQNAIGIAINGATVTLSGGQAGSTTTDASGNYSFSGLPSTNNYTVTPSLANYAFSPTSLTYNNLSANQTTANFTGTSTVTYTISGHIQNASTIAISGVTVTLSGGQSGSTTTDASGNYSFPGLPSTNNYTVTPSKANYTFSPTSLAYNNLSADQTAADFTGTSTINHHISGHIQNASGIAIGGVTVTLSGGQSGSTTTDASGNYQFQALPSTNNYTVTPSKTNYTFSPTSLTYNNLGAGQTTANFTGTSTITYTISGHIQNASAVAISGVTITLSGGQSGSTTTDVSGNYSFPGLPATNNYTVTPSKTNYTFFPASRAYNNLSADQTTANFTGTSTITYTISGHIQNASAIAISGVTVSLSGGGRSDLVVTDASGNYSITGLPSTNNYTLTPSKTGYAFTPVSLSYNNLSANQSDADFIGTRTYTISGHIQNASAIAISGVTITLSGTQTGTTTTDASGNYSFTGLPEAGNYTVTPSKTNYTFNPTSLTYNNLSANQTAAHFTGTSTITYTISGHIQNASAVAISGVTVTLSGGQSGSTITDASGNYSFTDLPSTNNYNVFPSKPSYTFSPTSLTYNSLSADQPTADFTAAQDFFTIYGYVVASGIEVDGATITYSGEQSGSTVVEGGFSFFVPRTGSYTVTASQPGYTFSPASFTFNAPSFGGVELEFTRIPAAQPPEVTLTINVSPTGSAAPGTDLVYTIDFSNVGGTGASAFVVTDPIPTNTDFKIGSVTADLGTTGLTVAITYSNNGGTTWIYTPLSGGGGAPAGFDRLVTDVRFSFSGTLSQNAPNNVGSVGFTARIR